MWKRPSMSVVIPTMCVLAPCGVSVTLTKGMASDVALSSTKPFTCPCAMATRLTASMIICVNILFITN